MDFDLAASKQFAETWYICLMMPVIVIHVSAGVVAFVEQCSSTLPSKSPSSLKLFQFAALGFLALSAMSFFADGTWVMWLFLAFMNVMIVKLKKRQTEQKYSSLPQSLKVDKPQ